MSNRDLIAVICGHINHGKTTLVERLTNKLNIVKRETDMITQDVSAYRMSDMPVIILDTPGHASFTLIKRESIRSADFAILVIDRTDGINTETKACIEWIREYSIPTIVYLSKTDLPRHQWKIEDDSFFSGTELDPKVYDVIITNSSLEDIIEINSAISDVRNMVSFKPYDLLVVNSVLDKNFGVLWVVISDTDLLRESFVQRNDFVTEVKVRRIVSVDHSLKYVKVEHKGPLKLGKYVRSVSGSAISNHKIDKSRYAIKFGIQAQTIGQILTLEDNISKWTFWKYYPAISYSGLGSPSTLDLTHLKINEYNVSLDVKVSVPNCFNITSINQLKDIYNKIFSLIITEVGTVIRIFRNSEGNAAVLGIELKNELNFNDSLFYNDVYLRLNSIEMDNHKILKGKPNDKVAIEVEATEHVRYNINHPIYRDNRKMKY